MPDEKPNQSMEPIEELIRLSVLQLRRGGDTQTSLIHELNDAGFTPGRLAVLLGTTAQTVRTAGHKAKKAKAPKKTSKRK